MQSDKEIKKKYKIKTTQKAKDTEIEIHQKMQLWTTEQVNEYALKLAISPNDNNNCSWKILFSQGQIPILDLFIFLLNLIILKI